eukprot:TRINITY_DN2474_c0_g1_i10.p1 TRINITY_DN2474_c0_g1~~TRINITY_DN2474_c0_g1_i10.p1  ORF type:complete len:826 (-),score=181.24 TRINITY_DN2474_c0_g1_i10:1651-3783(-)
MEIPTDLKELIEAFPDWLREASQRGGVVLVLDALNQLDPRDNSHDLGWLPNKLPPNVRIVASTLAGKCLDAVKSKKWSIMEILPLAKNEREALATEYLEQLGKTLTDNQLDRIVSSKLCESPLFLRTLLDELKVFGTFEKLDATIDYYLESEDIPSLFNKVFIRLENDYQTEEYPKLVGDILSLLYVSRKGLTEYELLDILKVPNSLWSPLYLAMQEYLVDKSGYFTFFHDYMRSAVAYRYQPQRYHRNKLIDYFSQDSIDRERFFEELPYQLEQCHEQNQLAAFITDMDNFFELSSRYKFDLYRYWRYASDLPQFENLALDSVNAVYNKSKRRGFECYSKVADFMQDIGQYESGEYCSRRSLEILEEIEHTEAELCEALENLGYILRLKGKYKDSYGYYRRALDIREVITNESDPKLASSVNGLAILCRLQGKYDIAEPLYNRALELRKKIYGEMHEDIAQSMNSLGCLNQDMGRYPLSEKFFYEAIRQRELVLGSNHPDVAMSLNNLGGLYLDWSKYDKAEPVYLRAKHIYELVFGYEHPHVAKSINSIAGLYQEQGLYEKAEPLYHECLKLKRRLLGSSHPDLALTLNDLAVLYVRMGDEQKAEKYYTECLSIRKQVLGESHPDYAQTLKNMASLYQSSGRYYEAADLFRESLTIIRSTFGNLHSDVASGLSSLASLYQLMGMYQESEGLYQEALDIFYVLSFTSLT